MFSLYRCLLWLYPSSHRREYGEEMTAVFSAARAEIEKKSAVTRRLFWFREIRGLVGGVLEEHAGRWLVLIPGCDCRQGGSRCIPNSVFQKLLQY
jgi:hypothetical protein